MNYRVMVSAMMARRNDHYLLASVLITSIRPNPQVKGGFLVNLNIRISTQFLPTRFGCLLHPTAH